MTINELIERAHKQARDAGFWDGERNLAECLMLIVSECGEALEAHRSGKMGDLQQFDARYPERNCQLSEDASLNLFCNAFKDYIKDTFEDELADIVIRIADLAGGLGVQVQGSLNNRNDSPENVGDALLGVTECIVMFGVDERVKGVLDGRWLETAIAFVAGIANDHNIDLWRHIELKLAYNKTRGIRHGKAY